MPRTSDAVPARFPHPPPTGPELRPAPSAWNDTARDYPRDCCIHELFEEQVRRTPDAAALRCDGVTLSYRELDERASRVAARLASLGAKPGTLAGILLERSPDMVLAVLGVLKTGAAYLPLDPSYPQERLELMLDDSRAPLLVTSSALAGTLVLRHATAVAIDDGRKGNAASRPLPRPSPGDLAYVIYTSGSTGRPKGVEVTHRNVVNFLTSMRERPGLTAGDVMLALTTLSFDIAGLELFLPLTTGAAIELVPRERAVDGRKLSAAMARSGATVVQATPATWRMLIETGWRGSPDLKILCGGEAMPVDLAHALLERCGSLWNVYGPTETTIWSTVEEVTPELLATAGANVPIGRPIANTTVYVLDEARRRVPLGVPGELYIGGEGVARGYRGRPELTAERFLRDPFSGPADARMYRTGDGARWREDGRLEFFGRLDSQVKLRGHRIELGEIETALRAHPAVADAVVALHPDAPGGAALAAYVVSRDPAAAPASGRELREFLRRTLPEPMVPAFVVPMQALPLTPNGKVDRRALPAPEPGQREGGPLEHVAPRDEIETRLAALWSQILGVPSPGIRDDFFELGGESLLAVRLFVAIEKAFGKNLPLATLIEAPTIEGLADVLRREGWRAPWSPLVAIKAGGSRPPFFCVHGVGGNVLNYRPLALLLGEEQPFFGLQARGLDGSQAPLTRIDEMADVYCAEVRKAQPSGPYFLGGASFGGVVAFEMARRLRAAGEEVGLVALFDTTPVGWSRLSPERAREAFEQSLTRRVRVHLDVVRHGPDPLRYLGKKIRRVWRKAVYRSWQSAYALFERMGRQLPAALQDVQQANYKALAEYAAEASPGEVVLFCALEEPEEFTREKERGWSVLARGGVDVRHVPGNHLTMLEEPHVTHLARTLREAIDARLRPEPASPAVRPAAAVRAEERPSAGLPALLFCAAMQAAEVAQQMLHLAE